MKQDFHMDEKSQLEKRIRDCAAEDRRLQREMEISERGDARENGGVGVIEDDPFEAGRSNYPKNKDSHRPDKHRRQSYS